MPKPSQARPLAQKPDASRTTEVHVHGMTLTVSYGCDDEQYWIEMVQIGGQWWIGEDVLSADFMALLDAQLTLEFLEDAEDTALAVAGAY